MESKKPGNKAHGVVKYVETYDFRQPKLFSKEIMRMLRTIHDVLGRNLGRIFSSSLRYKAEIHLHKIEQLSSSEYLQHIPSPSAIYILNVSELSGEIFVALPTEFCIHIIERQSGGQGSSLSEKRILTTLEEKIINRIVRNVNQEVVTAWEPYMEFSISHMSYESKPENLHLSSVDPNILITYYLELNETKIPFYISYSYSLLKKAMNDTLLKKGKNSRLEELSTEEQEAFKNTLRKAMVKIRPLLGTTRLTLNDIINLKEGDTIPLHQKAEDPLDIRVNGQTKMIGYPGVVRGRKAVRVFEILEEINETELV